MISPRCSALLLLLCAAEACSFDLAAVKRPRDPDQRIVQVVEGVTLPDRRLPRDTRAAEAPAVDQRAPDLRAPDSRAPDQRPPDLPPLDKPKPKPSCDDRYKSKVPGYVLCWEGPNSCKLFVNANGACDAACALGGGSCQGAQNNVNYTSCVPDLSWPIDCATVLNDKICECSR